MLRKRRIGIPEAAIFDNGDKPRSHFFYRAVHTGFAEVRSPQADAMRQTRTHESGSWFGMAPNATKALATALAIKPPMG